MSDNNSRRVDIQGLRAIAVLMVVLFHAGLPIPGGFVGVDVFFVISGFVITAMLHRQRLQEGCIRLRTFYWRRFKRLTPALSLMISVTLILSVLILSPLGSQQIAAKTAIGAMLLLSNVVVAFTTGGYFDAPAEANPLLNTWSLSVEEQFYLVFPALLVLGWVLAARWSRLRSAPVGIVGGIAAVSLALVVLESLGFVPDFGQSITNFFFYSPFTRAWEFAVGALLALLLTKRSRRISIRSRNILGMLGLALLASSGWLINSFTTFPGKWTLLPVVGTLLLLLAGSDQGSTVSRLLGTKPMVKIGDWSYSIYLWHWPLIVFATILWPFSTYAPIIALALSFLPAIASYHWVEQPLRQRTIRTRKENLSIAIMTFVIPMALAGAVLGTANGYFAPRLESDAVQAVNNGDLVNSYAQFEYMESQFFPCTLEQVDRNVRTDFPNIGCMQSQQGMDIQVAILGDSHAEHLFVGLAEQFKDINFTYVMMSRWPVSISENAISTFRQVSEDESIKSIVISAYWAYQYVPPENLERFLRQLVESGKEVLVTDDIPDYPFPAIECKYKVAPLAPTHCSRDASEFWAQHKSDMQPVLKAISSVQGVKLIRTAHYFCESERCFMANKGTLFYGDSNHLNIVGSRFLAKNLDEDYPELFDLVSNK